MKNYKYINKSAVKPTSSPPLVEKKWFVMLKWAKESRVKAPAQLQGRFLISNQLFLFSLTKCCSSGRGGKKWLLSVAVGGASVTKQHMGVKKRFLDQQKLQWY